MTQLKVRVFSALALVLLLSLTYLFFAKIGVMSFGLVIFLLGSHEYYKMEMQSVVSSKLFLSIFLGTNFFLQYMLSFYERPLLSLIVVVLCLYVSFCMVYLQNSKSIEDIKRFMTSSLIGFLYTSVFPSFIIKIFDQPNGEYLLLTLLGIVFAGDIAAYFVGSSIGKTKIAPTISPGKTVEGAIGGAVFSVAIGVSFLYLFQIDTPIFYNLSATLGIAILAQFGDFFESLIKRSSKVKDSGTLLPGHGGVLDRLDGVYFAAPAFYFFYIALPALQTLK
ncbi:MAG: phosphatidate cytidylyltransferase [Bdellovibrionales bacterium]|nr:phosphatidate cytidylyltransferase [Bdellovibrionales bacterium]